MTKSDIDIMVPRMVEKLDSLRSGTKISIAELVEKTFSVDTEYVENKGLKWSLDNGIAFFDNDLMDLIAPFEKAVRKAGYSISMGEERSMYIGLPYFIPKIYKRSRRSRKQ